MVTVVKSVPERSEVSLLRFGDESSVGSMVVDWADMVEGGVMLCGDGEAGMHDFTFEGQSGMRAWNSEPENITSVKMREGRCWKGVNAHIYS